MAECFFQGITDFIFLEDAPVKSDIIFLPGGNYPEGACYAAKLYHQGYAPYVLPSGRYSILQGEFEGCYETEWDYLHQILREKGVPDSAILKENQAEYTYENALYSRKVTDTRDLQIKNALLVSQAFHARRSRMYYQEQYPDAVIRSCPVETRGINRNTWYQSPEKIDVVLGEVERCGSQFHQIMREQLEKMQYEKQNKVEVL